MVWLLFPLIYKLCYAQQFYFEYKRRASGDAGLREFAVCHFRGDVDFPLIAYTHTLKGDNPSGYKFVKAYCHCATATATVEFLSVDGPSGVVYCNYAACRRLFSCGVARSYYFVIDAFRQ